MRADVAEQARAAAVPAPSRRDRVRAATSQEIIQTARRLLVQHGSAAVSLRAIAREMGMTAPALYRYYDSHEVLIQHVVADIFTDLADHLEAAIAAEPSPAADAADAGAATAAKLVVACRAFRDWAIAHQPEFGMIFGSPLPGVDLFHDNPLAECGMRMGTIFLTLFGDLWQATRFPAPAGPLADPALRAQVVRYRDQIGSDLPLEVLLVFLRCWILLYGHVAMEVFGHLKFAVDDAAPMFELVLGDLAAMVGLGYPG